MYYRVNKLLQDVGVPTWNAPIVKYYRARILVILPDKVLGHESRYTAICSANVRKHRLRKRVNAIDRHVDYGSFRSFFRSRFDVGKGRTAKTTWPCHPVYPVQLVKIRIKDLWDPRFRIAVAFEPRQVCVASSLVRRAININIGNFDSVLVISVNLGSLSTKVLLF